MQDKHVLETLSKLAQLDVDAWHAYAQAVERAEDAELKKHLAAYQGDHERHYRELAEIITGRGGEAPEFSRDFKGFLIGGFTSLAGAAGDKAALTAMRSNEKLTNRQYGEAVKQTGLPNDILDKLEHFFADERKHLHYIEAELDKR